MTSSTGLPALTMMRIGRGFCDAGDELGQLFGWEKPAFFAVLGDQRVGALVIAIEDRNAETLVRGVSREVCAHDGQSHNANVSSISHGFSALFGASLLS